MHDALFNMHYLFMHYLRMPKLWPRPLDIVLSQCNPIVRYSCLCGLLQLQDSFSTVSICDDGSFTQMWVEVGLLNVHLRAIWSFKS